MKKVRTLLAGPQPYKAEITVIINRITAEIPTNTWTMVYMVSMTKVDVLYQSIAYKPSIKPELDGGDYQCTAL